MSIKKEVREQIYMKYGGRCAYCGKEIDYKQMQVDHIYPKTLAHFLQSEKMMEEYPEVRIRNIEDIENLNPACRRCNIHKYNLTLEKFRRMISNKPKVLNTNWHYKFAIDYGLITESATPVIFYFEKIDAENFRSSADTLCRPQSRSA